MSELLAADDLAHALVSDSRRASYVRQGLAGRASDEDGLLELGLGLSAFPGCTSHFAQVSLGHDDRHGSLRDSIRPSRRDGLASDPAARPSLRVVEGAEAVLRNAVLLNFPSLSGLLDEDRVVVGVVEPLGHALELHTLYSIRLADRLQVNLQEAA